MLWQRLILMSIDESLSTADERRKQVFAVALKVFAVHGYHGSSTATIAKEAGISHSYLFKLYPTKKDLFVAVVDLCFKRIVECFQEAAVGVTGTPTERLKKIGLSYADILRDRNLMLIQLQAFSACSVPAIREAVKAGLQHIVEYIQAETGVADDEIQNFIGQGFLATMNVALGIEYLQEPWAEALNRNIIY
jgi:AcrR family transcriptional regulator